MKFSLRKLVLLAIAAVCLVGSQARAQVISTVPTWIAGGSSSTVAPWGSSNSDTPTYGQSFTATASNSVLQSGLFEIRVSSGNPIPYSAYVYAWSGTATTGSALATVTGLTASGSSFAPYTANFGGVSLTPGNQYVVLYSTIGLSASTGVGVWGGNLPDTTYTGGTFVYNPVATTLAGLSNPSGWNPAGNLGDSAFTFTFGGSAAVPEPSIWALMTVGSIAVGGGALLRRLRNKNAVAS